MNLAPYLDRLGLTSPLPPTLDTLRRVHVAHLAAFPFHNLAIQRGGAIEVEDPDAIATRFLAPGGGGYCFEQNTLLGAALRELGFAVTTLLARVITPHTRALNHMLLRVDADGEPFLADAGFGGEGLLHPIPLREGRVLQDGMTFALRRDAHHWTLSMQCGGVEVDHYEFTGTPHTTGDVVIANWYTSTHPQSVFRKSITIQRITIEERLILRPTVVTRYRNGVRTDTPIEPAQVRGYAKELFGIELGEEPLLFEMLSRG